MIYLGSKMLQYGDMVVIGDYADPLQFYYLPNIPHIALTEEGTPAIQLLIYRQDLDTVSNASEDAVAFLSLDVEVGFPDSKIQDVATQLQSDLKLHGMPQLTSLFYRSGTVRLLLLDAQSPDQTKDKPTDTLRAS